MFIDECFPKRSYDSGLPSFQVVDVELHRDTLVDDYIPLTSSSKLTHREASPIADPPQSFGHSTAHNTHVAGADKGTHSSVSLSKPKWERFNLVSHFHS